MYNLIYIPIFSKALRGFCTTLILRGFVRDYDANITNEWKDANSCILSEIPIQIPASYYIDIETKLPQLLLTVLKIFLL